NSAHGTNPPPAWPSTSVMAACAPDANNIQAIIPAPEIFFMMNPSFNGFNKLQLFCCYWQIEVASADVITITTT
ncbi:MAG: hypothetical protein AWT59_2015, partial [Candidatus Gallionella acididurans]